MATNISDLILIIRRHLVETTAGFWSDTELVDLMNLGVHDMWGAINDNFKLYFATLDVTNITAVAGDTQLTGVPSDVFRIELLEPRDISGTSTNPNMIWVPRDYRDPDFISARAQDAQDPFSLTVYYTVFQQGAPYAAPLIKFAPKLTSTVNMTLLYVPTLAKITALGTNPVPGESDGALVAWTMAFARAKEREDRQPDPTWLEIYHTEKTNLLSRITPRQTQDPDVADALWQPYW